MYLYFRRCHCFAWLFSKTCNCCIEAAHEKSSRIALTVSRTTKYDPIPLRNGERTVFKKRNSNDTVQRHNTEHSSSKTSTSGTHTSSGVMTAEHVVITTTNNKLEQITSKGSYVPQDPLCDSLVICNNVIDLQEKDQTLI